MRICTVVGARPQFIKAGAVSPVLREVHQEILIHTGQHYDPSMSAIFFKELDLPIADYNLGVGSASHAVQTGRMLICLEEIFLKEKPDGVLVYGDTNSTLAAALAAAKLHLPVIHVEAGLRSFNPHMPEEVNRRLTDHLSSFLFTPTDYATSCLEREGITQGVHQVGDVMYDVLLKYLPIAQKHACGLLERFQLTSKDYILATIHRAENTDDLERLEAILQSLIHSEQPVLFPIHPRTRKQLARLDKLSLEHIQLIEPVGYLEMLFLEHKARAILTDSGGVQKEAYLLAVPCCTIRDQTEWIETVTSGWNRLVPAQVMAIQQALSTLVLPNTPRPLYYGDGMSAYRIAQLLK
jgi:UDP-N-acetylglucosamine 2-epimerase